MHPLIDHAVQRIHREYPDALAILLKGSHARGEAGPASDIDIDVLVSRPEIEEYRTWLVDHENRLVHISVAVETLENWLGDSEEPSAWSMGLATAETTKLLWAANDELRVQLDVPAKNHPAMEPEVEDSVEYLGKIRNALRKGDEIGVYRNAQKLAHLIPTLLIPLNDPVVATSSRSTVDLITGFKVAPDGFARDWLMCIGYVGNRTVEETVAAAERMLRGALDLLPVDPELLGEDIATALADGSLMRYVEQLCESHTR